MASDELTNLAAALSAARVTPQTPTDAARTGWDLMESVLPAADGVARDDLTLGDIPASSITALEARPLTFLHLHGGGYVIGSPRSHHAFATHLAARTRSRVVVPDYRLAPESPAPAAIGDAVSAYRALIESGVDPDDLVISGDSAGGGLAVATLVALRDAGDALPMAAVLLSPWLDLTLSGDSMRTKVDTDIILSPELLAHWGDLYRGDIAADDPRVSPLFADLASLPPTFVLAASGELLLDDTTRFAERAAIDVTVSVWDEVFHVWPALAAGLAPEAATAIDEIAAFVDDRSSWVGSS